MSGLPAGRDVSNFNASSSMSDLLSNLPADVDSSSMNAVPGVCSHQPSPHRGIQSGIFSGLLSSPVSTYHSYQDSDYVQTAYME